MYRGERKVPNKNLSSSSKGSGNSLSWGGDRKRNTVTHGKEKGSGYDTIQERRTAAALCDLIWSVSEKPDRA